MLLKVKKPINLAIVAHETAGKSYETMLAPSTLSISTTIWEDFTKLWKPGVELNIDCLLIDAAFSCDETRVFFELLLENHLPIPPIIHIVNDITNHPYPLMDECEAYECLASHSINREILERAILSSNQKRKMQEKINSLNSRLTHANNLAVLGEMAASVMHEINNPLAVISSSTELLEYTLKSSDQKKQKSLIEKIDRATEKIVLIARGILKFSRAPQKIELENVELKNLLENEVIPLCADKMKRCHISLSLDIHENYAVRCTSIQLGQVLINLINNAVDAVTDLEQKWVKISVDEKKEKINLTITDSGNGIPEDIVSNMMSPFYTTKEEGKGTGLGLSISQGIINGFGGKLEYLSEESHTTFQIILPKAS